jgi:amino acid transporter
MKYIRVVLTGSRIITTTASNGFLPSKLANLDIKTKTPFNAIVSCNCLSINFLLLSELYLDLSDGALFNVSQFGSRRVRYCEADCISSMVLIGNFRFLLVMGGIMGMTLMLATVVGMFFLAKQQPDLKR